MATFVCVWHTVQYPSNLAKIFLSITIQPWTMFGVYLALENVFMFNFCSKMLLMVSNEKLKKIQQAFTMKKRHRQHNLKDFQCQGKRAIKGEQVSCSHREGWWDQVGLREVSVLW